ncbi:Gp49 family protein [Fulvimonas yonginensis]|uniref:Gp49 family protein n=1 Tax=Fulvimonas yonginensis TaxID=1495200 RepID=A0ABU8JB61_9GAMM
MNDEQIEQEIQTKGLTAPRVTKADVDDEIASEHFFTAFDGALGAASADNQDAESAVRVAMGMPPQLQLLTICVLVLRNGYTVTGESACASPENFDAEIGRKLAREKAVEKIWPLIGFRLRDFLSATQARG